jgi:hypothetical protein
MEKGYLFEGGVLKINRDLTELDYFVKDFLKVLKKHSDYLIVSGFVSISTGRSRATEDVDILVPILTKDKFKDLFLDLEDENFWCYQGDSADEIYENYVKEFTSIRFARKDQMFPNMEVIFIDKSKKAKYYEFSNPQEIKIKNFRFKIPPLEFEILYKEIILAGKKDLEDAKHLRILFKKILGEEKFKNYEKIIREELNEI